LRPAKTLGFFYEALDKAFEQVEADYGSDVKVAVLGHSIGGWVARSYIGEVMGAEVAAKKVCSLVTLGTPHNPPPKDSPVAALDQTRGLLTYINDKFPSGSPLPEAAVTCVAGTGTKSPASIGALLQNARENAWDEKARRSLLLEEVVALSSYFPLSGKAFDTLVLATASSPPSFPPHILHVHTEPYRLHCGAVLSALTGVGRVRAAAALCDATVQPLAVMQSTCVQLFADGLIAQFRQGDGLIPVETALMEGCGKVTIDDCNHAAFVPTLGPSLRLPDTYKWYGSPDLIDRWVKHL
jgi:pimeloyl-ACP methyl ester carboxylesterase